MIVDVFLFTALSRLTKCKIDLHRKTIFVKLGPAEYFSNAFYPFLGFLKVSTINQCWVQIKQFTGQKNFQVYIGHFCDLNLERVLSMSGGFFFRLTVSIEYNHLYVWRGIGHRGPILEAHEANFLNWFSCQWNKNDIKIAAWQNWPISDTFASNCSL
jgi:hypothetical protein